MAGVLAGYLGTWVEGLANPLLSPTCQSRVLLWAVQLLGIEARSDGSSVDEEWVSYMTDSGTAKGSLDPRLVREALSCSRCRFSGGDGNSGDAYRRAVQSHGPPFHNAVREGLPTTRE